MGNNDDTPTLVDAEEAFERGDIDTAMMICEGLLGENEEQAPAEVQYLAAECLLELQEPAEALHLVHLALEQAPDEPVLLNAQGICLFELARLDEAASCFERASKLSESLGEARFYLGILAERDGDDERAMQLFAQAVDLEPETLLLPSDWSKETIARAVDEIVDEAPEPLGRWLQGLKVEIREMPQLESLQGESPVSPLILCMFEGGERKEPRGSEPSGWLSSHPDTAVMFRRNLCKCAHDEYELHRELLEAIVWELAEFLGLQQEHLEALGLSSTGAEEADA